jgi:hypothetical protein
VGCFSLCGWSICIVWSLRSPNNFIDSLWTHFEQPCHFGDWLAIGNKSSDLFDPLWRDSTSSWLRSKRTATIFTDVALCTTPIAAKADTLLRCASCTGGVRKPLVVRKIVHYTHITKVSSVVTFKSIDPQSQLRIIAQQSLGIDINR